MESGQKNRKQKKRFYKFCQSHAMLTTTEDEGNSELRALHLVKNKHGMTCKIGAAIAKCNLDFMHYKVEVSEHSVARLVYKNIKYWLIH
jgi:hypothetical protein